MTKQETIKYLTELMATVQMAYFKGRLGERNTVETGYDGAKCGDLWVHERSNDDAGIAIDLYDFGGDKGDVCPGLHDCTVTLANGKTDKGWLYCMDYIPEEKTPLLFVFESDTDGDKELDPEAVPEEVLQGITKWLEGVFNKLNDNAKKPE